MSLNTFRVTYPSGKILEETVIDCDTTEAFIMRHFGSVDPAEHGIDVDLIAIDGQKPPADNAAPQADVVPMPAPTPAPANAATDAPAVPFNPLAKPTAE
jgi:hypothetical protein